MSAEQDKIEILEELELLGNNNMSTEQQLVELKDIVNKILALLNVEEGEFKN